MPNSPRRVVPRRITLFSMHKAGRTLFLSSSRDHAKEPRIPSHVVLFLASSNGSYVFFCFSMKNILLQAYCEPYTHISTVKSWMETAICLHYLNQPFTWPKTLLQLTFNTSKMACMLNCHTYGIHFPSHMASFRLLHGSVRKVQIDHRPVYFHIFEVQSWRTLNLYGMASREKAGIAMKLRAGQLPLKDPL